MDDVNLPGLKGSGSKGSNTGGGMNTNILDDASTSATGGASDMDGMFGKARAYGRLGRQKGNKIIRENPRASAGGAIGAAGLGGYAMGKEGQAGQDNRPSPQKMLARVALAYKNGRIKDGQIPEKIIPRVQKMADNFSKKELKQRMKKTANMDKAEKTFQKIAQSFEAMANRQMNSLQRGVDAYNARVKKETAKGTGQAAGIGAGAGAGGTALYDLLQGKGGGKKTLMKALKGGGVGAGVGAAAGLGYLLPKAMDAHVTRSEERALTDALDERQDAARMQRIRSAFRDYASRLQDNDPSQDG